MTDLTNMLYCRHCGHATEPTRDQVASYFRSGWPKHCTSTMEWITRPQIERGYLEKLPKAIRLAVN